MNGNSLLTVLLFANGLNAKHNACAFFPAKRHRCEAFRPRGPPRPAGVARAGALDIHLTVIDMCLRHEGAKPVGRGVCYRAFTFP